MEKFTKHWFKYVAVIGVVLILPIIVSAGDSSDNSRDEVNSAILQELKQIRALLERIEKNGIEAARAPAKPQKPRVAEISSVNRPVMGEKDAPITIVGISDFQCPFCKRFSDSTMKSLRKDFIKTGKVRFVMKDLPLPMHTMAEQAAQAAHCAGDQGKYWHMHDKLYENMNKYQDGNLVAYAKDLKLDVKSFKDCISSDRHIASIKKDMADAEKAGLNGTPSFVIGKTTNDVIKGEVIQGALPISVFEQYIQKYLDEEAKS